MRQFQFLLAVFILSSPFCLQAQDNDRDTTESGNTTNVRNRNVMLNASSDNRPRQISIGLPAAMSSFIWEDGLPVSYTIWPSLPYLVWTNTAAHESNGLQSLGESAITFGEVNYVVVSGTRTGKDEFEGHVNYTANIYGLQRFDMNAAGQISPGWYFSIGAYDNLDPGSNKAPDVRYQMDMKIFKGALTRRWDGGRGEASVFYRYTNTRETVDGYGPFIYVGDGSVKEYNGFRLGHDSFLPANEEIRYLDVKTGEEVDFYRKDGNHVMNNSLTFNFKYDFLNGMRLNAVSKYNYSSVRYTNFHLAGIGYADETSGYTYAYDTDDHKEEETFSGYYNSRYLLYDEGYERDWLTTFELTGGREENKWRLGANLWWNRQGIDVSTGVYAHTVEKNPVWLERDGCRYFAANTGSNGYDAYGTKFAIYASKDWVPDDRFRLSSGLRLEYNTLGGHNNMAYLHADDKEPTYPENIRVVNWSKKDGRRTKFSNHWLNPAATVKFSYSIWNGAGVLGEYIYTMQHPKAVDFCGPYMPVLKAVNIHFGSIGIFWNTPWMQLVSQATYISKSNFKSRPQFTNPNDASDVVTMPITYTVRTIGWTTDVVLTPFKGFSFHGLLTLQSPKYEDFTVTPTFSDGTSKTYDFSGNTTTGISKTIVELDPSYSFWKLRLWGSFRYQSKQYINKTNTLYFDGRWETFAGIDYKLNDKLSFDVNFINLLNQKGCSGSINAADLLDDVSAYKNCLMAGEYIRPFTVEFSVHLNF